MSLPFLQALAQLTAHLATLPGLPRRIGFLGYPDLVYTPRELAAVLGEAALPRLRMRPNAERLRALHGAGAECLVPAADSLLEQLSPHGFTAEYLDFQDYTGEETILDLNRPLPPGFAGRYALLVDGGTLEHVFDIALAFSNCAAMVAVGGYVLHSLPLNAFNHGFWNINPTALVEFHEANGFETTLLKLNPWHAREVVEAPPFERFRLPHTQETNVFYIARRAEPCAGFHYPIQRRYRDAEAWR
ncbi:hypothetical protein [Teichococcus cervicalis]|uniref:Uncharacterized protein n=1 Tax=Pseudoroseomonas cervicalis ATCC 49957 TaxID=525371 RepID=D5RG64_9PROT|nr:hypothetical protein [Pseudoroseomonas cervicalis]EFH13715.1 hypothetical protein HMPREF0731_0073 [Pseudoroseomonas cervicalis ATCC 49957]